MPHTHKLTPVAQQDYESILRYIAQDNLAAALRVRDQFEDAFTALARNPYLGHTREDITAKPVRFRGIHTYQIIYDPQSSPLYIIRIVSGYRDINAMLDDESL